MKINISGKSVRFKANALFPVKYKQLTHRDIFKDLLEIESLQNFTVDKFNKFNIDVFYDIIYTLAWFGDKNIPERDEWLLSFDELDVFEILPQVLDLLTKSLEPAKKKKNSTTKKQIKR